jgi:hypothetical protein
MAATRTWVIGCSLALGCASDDAQSGDDTSTTTAGTETSGDGDGDGDGDPLVDACVAKVNEYRAMLGVPPVSPQTDQHECATEQAAKGAADLEATGTTTFHAYYGECSELYQNECWYSVDDPIAVLDWCLDAFWQEGPPPEGTLNHYSIMTDPASTTLACGFAQLSGGGYWMTNDYY